MKKQKAGHPGPALIVYWQPPSREPPMPQPPPTAYAGASHARSPDPLLRPIATREGSFFTSASAHLGQRTWVDANTSSSNRSWHF
jgi:hypothetical protein